MAISSTNYVGTSVKGNVQNVGLVMSSLAGLVITGASMGETEDETLALLKSRFEAGEAVALTAGQAEARPAESTLICKISRPFN